MSKTKPKTYKDYISTNTPIASSNLKKLLYDENLLLRVCSECGQTETWKGKPLSLELDHINGDSNDNRLENLRILCPNCHSQTPTFSRRKDKKKKQYCKRCGKEIWYRAEKGFCRACHNIETSYKKRRVERPSKEVLLSEILKLGYRGTAKLYGVSDNSIRKWEQFYLKVL